MSIWTLIIVATLWSGTPGYKIDEEVIKIPITSINECHTLIDLKVLKLREVWGNPVKWKHYRSVFDSNKKATGLWGESNKEYMQVTFECVNQNGNTGGIFK